MRENAKNAYAEVQGTQMVETPRWGFSSIPAVVSFFFYIQKSSETAHRAVSTFLKSVEVLKCRVTTQDLEIESHLLQVPESVRALFASDVA